MLDANALPEGQSLHCAVCIVGAGAVGLTLATELATPGRHVLVIEAGPLNGAAAGSGDAAGDSPQGPDDVHGEAGYGGRIPDLTPRLWPIGATERAPRPFLPDADWPVPDAEFDRWLAAARPRCGAVGATPPTAVEAPLIRGLRGRRFVDDRLDERASLRAIGTTLRPVLAARAEVCVLANVRATAIELGASGTAAGGLRLRSRNGRRLSVTAEIIVLTGGTIETTRLLLGSRLQWPDGVGPASSTIGTAVMTPLTGVLGSLRLRHEPAACWIPGSGRRYSGRPLLLTAELQRDLALPAMAFRLRAAAAAGRSADPQARNLRHRYRLSWRCEQRPDPGNRLLPAGAPDADGRLPLRLSWQVADADLGALRQALALLDRDLREAGVGQFDHDPGALLAHMAQPPALSALVGGARMGRDPQRSVVDPDGRVHGVDGLYVCGPAVFPTSGIDDGLLTSIALALRLAEHLRQRLDRPSPAVASPAAARLLSAPDGG